MCKYLSRKKIKSFYFRGTKTAQPALQVCSVISDNTYLSDTSKAERTRGGESRESLPSSSERRQLKSHTSGNKQFKESCQKRVTKETRIPFFIPRLTRGYCTSLKHSCCEQYDYVSLLRYAENSHDHFHIELSVHWLLLQGMQKQMRIPGSEHGVNDHGQSQSVLDVICEIFTNSFFHVYILFHHDRLQGLQSPEMRWEFMKVSHWQLNCWGCILRRKAIIMLFVTIGWSFPGSKSLLLGHLDRCWALNSILMKTSCGHHNFFERFLTRMWLCVKPELKSSCPNVKEASFLFLCWVYVWCYGVCKVKWWLKKIPLTCWTTYDGGSRPGLFFLEWQTVFKGNIILWSLSNIVTHLCPDFCMPLYMYGEEERKGGGNNDCLLSETAAKFIVGYLRMSSALWLDFVTQNQVGGKSEDQEENPQHHEVYIELGIFHVQQQ